MVPIAHRDTPTLPSPGAQPPAARANLEPKEIAHAFLDPPCQGMLHGAHETTRAAFQAKRRPGMRRTLCGVSVATDRPLVVSAAYERMTS